MVVEEQIQRRGGREASDPNSSPPTSSKPCRHHRLWMYGGERARKREKVGREACSPFRKLPLSPTLW